MKAKPKAPTPPLEVVFIGRDAEAVRAAAAVCGMTAVHYVRMMILVGGNPAFQEKMGKIVDPKKWMAVGREGFKMLRVIEERSKLKLVKGGKK